MRLASLFLHSLVLTSSFAVLLACRAQGRISPSTSPATPAPTLSPREAYKELVRSLEKTTSRGGIPSPQDTKFVLFVPSEPRLEEQPFYSGNGFDLFGRIVSNRGVVAMYSAWPYGRKGDMASLPALQLQRLDQLLSDAPRDAGYLPPVGRRLILLVGQGKRYDVRVYDRAQLPTPILDMVSVFGGRDIPVAKTIGETSHWSIHQGFDDLAFGASADGNLVVSRTINDKLKVWNPQTHALVTELPDPNPGFNASFGFSPAGSLAVLVAGWQATVVDTSSWKKLYHFSEPEINSRYSQLALPQFTADGRYLLLQSLNPTGSDNHSNWPYSFLPQTRIYDMKTGKSVETLAEMPAGARTYVASPQGRYAVYLSSQGGLKLWDSKRKRDVATLESYAHLSEVSFSPDNSQVAVVTVEKDKVFNSWKAHRIQIWKTSNGKLLHELVPNETGQCDSVTKVLWSPDSRYVLGAICPSDNYSSWEVAVWNANTGRHRGTLFSGGQVIEGMALLPDGQLLVASRDSIVRMFDSKQAFSKIQEFEKSLPSA